MSLAPAASEGSAPRYYSCSRCRPQPCCGAVRGDTTRLALMSENATRIWRSFHPKAGRSRPRSGPSEPATSSPSALASAAKALPRYRSCIRAGKTAVQRRRLLLLPPRPPRRPTRWRASASGSSTRTSPTLRCGEGQILAKQRFPAHSS